MMPLPLATKLLMELHLVEARLRAQSWVLALLPASAEVHRVRLASFEHEASQELQQPQSALPSAAWPSAALALRAAGGLQRCPSPAMTVDFLLLLLPIDLDGHLHPQR